MDAATQWVRSLAPVISRGGEEADLAIRALGLLIEREKVSHPGGDDGGVEELLGPELAARKLTPLAIHEAVDLLISHLTAVRIPEPGIVWALTKSFDPRIVPHLAALLERVVDDPAHQVVAAQTVEGLTCFLDPRGQGDARTQAAYWLRLRNVDALPAGPAKLHAPASSVGLPANAYHLQRRPGTSQVVVNDGPGGIIVLDPTTGAEVSRAALSPGFPRDRLVRRWCLSADGAQAVVFAEGGAGSLVSLATATSVDVTAPLDGDVEDLRYIWDDRLIIAVGEIGIVFGLATSEGAATFEKLRSLEVRRDYRGWMRCVGALPGLSSRVIRTEPREHRMLAYDFAKPPGELAVFDGEAGVEFRVPTSQFVPAIAYRPGHLFLIYDHEIQAVDAHGAATDVFPVPDGLYFRAADIVGDSLVAAATRLDDPRSSMLLTYRVAD
jgi:hypothetical protein